MKRVLITLLILLPPLFSVSKADIIEVELPGLAGPSGDPAKIDSFTYLGPPVDVNDVSVRFSGTVYDRGLIACAVPPGADPYFVWWLDCDGSVWKKGAVGEGKWQGWSILIYLGPFSHARTYSGGFGSLEDGDVVEMELDFSMNDDWQPPSPMGYCTLITESYGELTSVTVILDVSQKVPVESSTWGRIKNLKQ